MSHFPVLGAGVCWGLGGGAVMKTCPSQLQLSAKLCLPGDQTKFRATELFCRKNRALGYYGIALRSFLGACTWITSLGCFAFLGSMNHFVLSKGLLVFLFCPPRSPLSPGFYYLQAPWFYKFFNSMKWVRGSPANRPMLVTQINSA